jgi:hypothetical protein
MLKFFMLSMMVLIMKALCPCLVALVVIKRQWNISSTKNPPKGRVRHERRKKLLEISDVRNCTKDEGMPLEVGLQEQASNHLKRL